MHLEFGLTSPWRRTSPSADPRRFDIPAAIDEPQDMLDWLDARGIRHRNAAVYFPRPHVADPLNDNRLRNVAASGTMAGIYARRRHPRGLEGTGRH